MSRPLIAIPRGIAPRDAAPAASARVEDAAYRSADAIAARKVLQ